MDNVVRGIVTRVTGGEDGMGEAAFEEVPEISEYECYYAVIDHFNGSCFRLSDDEYALRRLYVFANLCNMGYKRESILDAIDRQCNSDPHISVH